MSAGYVTSQPRVCVTGIRENCIQTCAEADLPHAHRDSSSPRVTPPNQHRSQVCLLQNRLTVKCCSNPRQEQTCTNSGGDEIWMWLCVDPAFVEPCVCQVFVWCLRSDKSGTFLLPSCSSTVVHPTVLLLLQGM